MQDESSTVLGTGLVNLLSARLGAEAIACSDDRFASMKNLVIDKPATFTPETFDSAGQIYSGWESARNYKRTPEHEFDWCVLKLGAPGVIHLIDVDTSFFKQNYPALASLEGTQTDTSGVLSDKTIWTTLLGKQALRGHSRNLFAIKNDTACTHVRLKMYPDGGIARLRAYGRVSGPPLTGVVDLASILNGALSVTASDMFYSPISNMIMPGTAENLAQGWETARKRGSGNNWAVIELAAPGEVEKVELDTRPFKFNAPESCSLEGVRAEKGSVDVMNVDQLDWKPILPRTKTQAHAQHTFEKSAIQSAGVVSHVRLQIYPCGGMGRLRVLGRVSA